MTSPNNNLWKAIGVLVTLLAMTATFAFVQWSMSDEIAELQMSDAVTGEQMKGVNHDVAKIQDELQEIKDMQYEILLLLREQ